jgi:hypothetical protein
MNTSLAAQLRDAREARRVTTADDEWKAVKAILDDVHVKATHPPHPEAAGALPPSCGFVLSDGPDPVFRFDPYEAVRRLAPGTPETAWHNETDWIISRIERITKLDVSWDPEAKVMVLEVPPPEPQMMFAEMRIDVSHTHAEPKFRTAPCRCAAKKTQAAKVCPHRRGPRGNNVAAPNFGLPTFTFGDLLFGLGGVNKTVPAPQAPAPAPGFPTPPEVNGNPPKTCGSQPEGTGATKSDATKAVAAKTDGTKAVATPTDATKPDEDFVQVQGDKDDKLPSSSA